MEKIYWRCCKCRHIETSFLLFPTPIHQHTWADENAWGGSITMNFSLCAFRTRKKALGAKIIKENGHIGLKSS